MSSNPLIDGLRRWRPPADWRCLANSRVAAQACVRRLWVVGKLPLVTWQRIRGGWSTRCAIQIDVLPFTLPLMIAIDIWHYVWFYIPNKKPNRRSSNALWPTHTNLGVWGTTPFMLDDDDDYKATYCGSLVWSHDGHTAQSTCTVDRLFCCDSALPSVPHNRRIHDEYSALTRRSHYHSFIFV